MTQPRLGDDSAFWTETVIAEYSEGDDSAVHKKSPVQIKHDNAWQCISLPLQYTGDSQ